jgi:hypothetical protein
MSSPLEIKIAMHYWALVGDYEDGKGEHWNSPAVQSILGSFVHDGLLKRAGNEVMEKYQRTDALGVWVDAICAVPKPVQMWIIPPMSGGLGSMERQQAPSEAMMKFRDKFGWPNGDTHV